MDIANILNYFKHTISLLFSHEVTNIITLSVIGLIIGTFLVYTIISKNTQDINKKALKISQLIKSASFIYLRKQYLVIGTVSIPVALLTYKIFGINGTCFFLLGILSSTFAGFTAMYIALNANIHTVDGAMKNGLSGAFKNTVYASAGASFILNAIGILTVLSSLYFNNLMSNLVCLMLGVSQVSIFARLGGGIFTKGADVGADMVGKNQMNLPEDDPRNPAVIADNVGDNVGDIAGMSADLAETYIVSIASCIMIAIHNQLNNLYLPLTLCGLGLLSSILPLMFMRFQNVWKELSGYFDTAVCFFILSVFMLFKLKLGINSIEEFVCVLIGAVCVVGILKITEYYTSSGFSPVQNVINASKSGDGANVIFGLAYGFESVLLPVLMVIVSICICCKLCGIWGIALGVLGITALSPAILLLDICGPISDNAGGIAEMSGLDENIRKITDELDAIGNTTKAITKGYAISSTIFASLIMFFFFQYDLKSILNISLHVDLFNPFIICGLLLGSTLPFVFSSMGLKSVSKAAHAVAQEVQQQFRDNPKILTGEVEPDYKKTIEFLTNFAIKEMILPGLLPIIFILSIFFICNIYDQAITFQVIASFLIGVTITGSLLSILMTVSGGLWDNVKKTIEKSGEKGSLAHKASVTGDTVGDPFKDAVGTSLNSFIKFTNIIAMLLIFYR